MVQLWCKNNEHERNAYLLTPQRTQTAGSHAGRVPAGYGSATTFTLSLVSNY